jgi:hypothetical protein
VSTPAVLFSIYLFIGLLLMVVAVAYPGRDKRTKGLEMGGDGDAFDAALLLFIALLWPIWLFTSLMRKDPKA